MSDLARAGAQVRDVHVRTFREAGKYYTFAGERGQLRSAPKPLAHVFPIVERELASESPDVETRTIVMRISDPCHPVLSPPESEGGPRSAPTMSSEQYGVFASHDLEANELIGQYFGPIRTADEYTDHVFSDPTCRLQMNSGYAQDVMQVRGVEPLVICGDPLNCRAALLNDFRSWRDPDKPCGRSPRCSCSDYCDRSPNLQQIQAFMRTETSIVPAVLFLTKRAVPAGEELLIDYGQDYWECYWRAHRTVTAFANLRVKLEQQQQQQQQKRTSDNGRVETPRPPDAAVGLMLMAGIALASGGCPRCLRRQAAEDGKQAEQPDGLVDKVERLSRENRRLADEVERLEDENRKLALALAAVASVRAQCPSASSMDEEGRSRRLWAEIMRCAHERI
uniref:SET domain-containing protein n=1 Tax=Tetraselmis sp. GSL018 TaxID=582737 RepID=A0A061RQE5_9CHLO